MQRMMAGMMGLAACAMAVPVQAADLDTYHRTVGPWTIIGVWIEAQGMAVCSIASDPQGAFTFIGGLGPDVRSDALALDAKPGRPLPGVGAAGRVTVRSSRPGVAHAEFPVLIGKADASTAYANIPTDRIVDYRASLVESASVALEAGSWRGTVQTGEVFRMAMRARTACFVGLQDSSSD